MNAKELYTGEAPDYRSPELDWAAIDRQTDANWDTIARIDAEAIAEGAIAGRFIYFPVADGQAVYQIIRENKASCRVRQCRGLGDDWSVPGWGNETTLPMSHVRRLLNQRDALARLFSGRQE